MTLQLSNSKKLKINCSTFIFFLIDCVCILWVKNKQKAKPNFNSILFHKSEKNQHERQAVWKGEKIDGIFKLYFLFISDEKNIFVFTSNTKWGSKTSSYPIKWLYKIPLLCIFHPIRSSLCFPFLSFPLSFLNLFTHLFSLTLPSLSHKPRSRFWNRFRLIDELHTHLYHFSLTHSTLRS